MKKETKPKKEETKQIVEIHIYVHQNPNTLTINPTPNFQPQHPSFPNPNITWC